MLIARQHLQFGACLCVIQWRFLTTGSSRQTDSLRQEALRSLRRLAAPRELSALVKLTNAASRGVSLCRSIPCAARSRPL